MNIDGIEKVYCHTVDNAEYVECNPIAAPELAIGFACNSASVALRSLLYEAGLDKENFGSANWNPFSEIISNQDTVLIKPNWVNHVNQTGERGDCLITHRSLIEAVVEYVLLCEPKKVIIADAPIQSCDFELLSATGGINSIKAKFQDKIQIKDLRLIRQLADGSIHDIPGRYITDYTLFDLEEKSLLEPVSSNNTVFRVACYDPVELKATHSQGKHQYYMANEVIDADVVINMPKLKTHKKGGVTGALKNIVGAVGYKSHLPHHRKGSSQNGGDCYNSYCFAKHIAEVLIDIKNSSSRQHLCNLLDYPIRVALKISDLTGHGRELDGSWHGNDTIWRTCLDLQRILYYGCKDGTLSNSTQRTVLTITDGIIAGEGEGPLSPSPIHAGILTLGFNTAAIDHVHTCLMGFDPESIPLVREAFGNFEYPIAIFNTEDIITVLNGSKIDIIDLIKRVGKPFIPPSGWREHCEDHRYLQHPS